jgi:hypothetical protein
LLDVNLAMALATLATNKSYLGLTHRPWDPILLGLLLIATAIAVRRRLSNTPERHRRGFTAYRLLSSDKRALSLLGTASVSVQPDVSPAPHQPDDFTPGGGRSGGAGASGSF